MLNLRLEMSMGRKSCAPCYYNIHFNTLISQWARRKMKRRSLSGRCLKIPLDAAQEYRRNIVLLFPMQDRSQILWREMCIFHVSG